MANFSNHFNWPLDAFYFIDCRSFRAIKLIDSIKCNNYNHVTPQNPYVTVKHHVNLPRFINIACNWVILSLSLFFKYSHWLKCEANGLRDRGSVLGRVIPKTPKMVFDAALFNTQHYKVMITGKVEKSWEWSSTIPYTSV